MSSRFGKVGVLYGGRSAEREVSLMSGAGVCEALRSAGVDAHLFDTGERSLAELAEQGYERVFIALHGRFGEDGSLQGALELLGIPYTGSGPLASALAMDKIMTKRVWLQAGLPTPKYMVLDDTTDLAEVPALLGLPLIVKAPHEGSTLGLRKVVEPGEMAAAYGQAIGFDSEALAEQFIEGRELTVAVLGSGPSARALPVIEIVAPQGNYDYEHKYFSDDTRYVCPAELPETLADGIRALSEQAYRALGCEGWGRVDIMLDAQNRPWLLEINTSPGMTGHSLVPMAAKADGMSYAELCVEILAGASCKLRGAARAETRRETQVWNEARTTNLIANMLAVAAVLAMAFALVVWLVQRPAFTLASIELLPAPDSELHYVSPASVRATVAGRLYGNFFTVDLDEARSVFESVPWVRGAYSVRRVWPNALRVTIEEQQPLALWNENQMINTWGEAFTANQGEVEDESGIPQFVGPEGTESLIVQRYAELVRWFAPLGVRVDRIELTPRYAWQVNLSNGMTLDLGRDPGADAPDPHGVPGALTFASRVERFVRAWPAVLQRLEGREVTHADLRYPNGFALKLVDMPESQPKKKQ